MDKDQLDKEITEVAETIEKSQENQDLTSLKTIIKAMTREELQDKVQTLTEGEFYVFKSVLEDIKADNDLEKGKKAVEFDKENKISYVQGNLKDTVIQEDKADDDADELLVKEEAAEHKHQGDESPEGKDGQKIEDPKKAKKKDIKKSETEEVVEATEVVEEEVIEKGMEKDKMVDEDIKAEIEAKADKKPEAKKDDDKKEIEVKEAVEVKVIKKAIVWNVEENRLLKANTLGRNHTFSVEAYIDAVVKSQKEADAEALVKSESTEEDTEIKTIEDYIVKGLDTTEVNRQKDLSKGAYDEYVAPKMSSVTSFSEDELARLCGVEVEDPKKTIVKAKKAGVGEVRMHADGKKRRKVAPGKWVEVKASGSTKIKDKKTPDRMPTIGEIEASEKDLGKIKELATQFKNSLKSGKVDSYAYNLAVSGFKSAAYMLNIKIEDILGVEVEAPKKKD